MGYAGRTHKQKASILMRKRAKTTCTDPWKSTRTVVVGVCTFSGRVFMCLGIFPHREKIKSEGSSVNDKSSNSRGACLRKLAGLPRGPQACNCTAHRGTTAATAYTWSAHVWRNRRTYCLWACSASAPHTRRGGCGIDAAAPVGERRRPTAYCRRDSAWTGTDLAVHHCLSDAWITYRLYIRGEGTNHADDLGAPRPRPAPRWGTIVAVGCGGHAWS